ncbi:MAG: hypothetical protein WCB19_02850 [Thermoplasmata archaeon]
MARRRTLGKTTSKKSKPPRARTRGSKTPKRASPPHFVGRAGSPVLERYTPKSMDAAVGEVVASLPPPPKPAPSAALPTLTPPSAPGPTPAALSSAAGAPVGPPKLLISLEKPFDVDEFAQLLGQTQIQVTVPRDSLVEVLRRVCDFMGFGIYVYAFRVRPGPEELLKTFIVELQRVDFSSSAHDWMPFQDRGRADSPFGPTGTR